MIAQLSPSVPRGNPAASSVGVRCGGYFCTYSGPVVWPHTSCSSKSSPAARTKMRTVRLLTLGLRMFSVFVATSASQSVVGVLRSSVVRERRARPRDERLDRVGEVALVDVVVAALDAQLVRLEQHLRVRVRIRRLEAVGRQLDQQPERVLEVDRVHEAAVLDAAVPDPALVEPLDGLPERRLREGEGHVVDAAGIGRRPRRVGLPLLVREDGDQAPVARVEVEVALGLVVEVRLLEDERHPEHALPEVERGLPIGADDRDVVDALGLELPHRAAAYRSTSFDLYSLRPRVPHGTSSTRVWTTSTLRSLSRIASASASSAGASRASSTATGSGGSCFTPDAAGLTRMCPLTAGANEATTSRTAAGKTLTPRTISMSSVRPMHRMRGVVRPHAHRLVQTRTWSRVRKRRSGAAR